MKKSTKKLTSVFLALLMMLTIIPMGAMSAFAADTFKTNILVNEKFVTSSYKSGTGWSYDNATATLTLNGFSGKLSSEWTEETNLDKLKIKLTGSNTVNNANYDMTFRYIHNVTIDGTGSLTVKGNKAAESNTDTVASFFNVTINNATINVSTDRDIALFAEGSVKFNSGKLNLTSAKYQIYTNGMMDGGLKLASGTSITSGVKYYNYNSDWKVAECAKADALMMGKPGAAVVISKSSAPTVGTVKLSATKYTYDGKVKSPTLTVKNTAGATLKKGTDYTVTVPTGRKLVGKYTYKLTFKGKYSGTKSVSFTIVPKNTSITKLTATKGGFKATIKKYTTQTNGYQIRYSTSSKMTNAKTVTMKNSTTSKSVTGLAKGKKYYVQIRTYKTVGKTNYYSSWSTAKTITTKK